MKHNAAYFRAIPPDKHVTQAAYLHKAVTQCKHPSSTLPHRLRASTCVKSSNNTPPRSGRDGDPDCWRQDEVLSKIAEPIRNFGVIYLCDLDEVPDFKTMYELYDPMTVMFFFRNKHMMCDFGTGNNNKMNWVLEDKQELIDIVETIYRGAKKGRGLVVSPKDYSTRYRY